MPNYSSSRFTDKNESTGIVDQRTRLQSYRLQLYSFKKSKPIHLACLKVQKSYRSLKKDLATYFSYGDHCIQF